MGAIGSDIAIENADIALMADNLTLISYLVNLGRTCLGKIRFNIAFAVIIKLLFLADWRLRAGVISLSRFSPMSG